MNTANSLQAGMSDKCAVLVVEDDELIRETLCSVLEAEGFEVTCCGSGLTALDYVREGCFRVIITDHGLPGMDGAEMVRIVRSQCPSTFIIGVSAGRRERDFTRRLGA
jgi:CheY-like chemotaxis protein